MQYSCHSRGSDISCHVSLPRLATRMVRVPRLAWCNKAPAARGECGLCPEELVERGTVKEKTHNL